MSPIINPQTRRLLFKGTPQQLADHLPVRVPAAKPKTSHKVLAVRMLCYPVLLLVFLLTGEERTGKPKGARHLLEGSFFC